MSPPAGTIWPDGEHIMRTIFDRLRYFLRRSRHDADLREEMETHRSLRQEQLERAGVAPAAAILASRRAFGNATLAREDAREMWLAGAVDRLLQDVRHAGRRLFRRPAPTLAAVITLALAIGANLTVFSLIDRVLLRPLDVPNPSGLVTVQVTADSRGVANRRLWLPWANTETVLGVSAFQDVAASSASIDRASQEMAVAGDPGERFEGLKGMFVTANYFRVLGLMPALGRDFGQDDDMVDAAPVVMLSHRMWMTRFGGEADVVGRTVQVNGVPATVIGIAPRTFTGTDLGAPSPDLYLPLRTAPRLASDIGRQTDGRGGFYTGSMANRGLSPISPVSDLTVVARVPQGFTAQAEAEMRTRLGSQSVSLVPLTETMLPFASQSDLRRFMALLAGAVGLTFLIGCANLTGLLLARTEERRPELAVRAALGAGRVRLFREMATEAGLMVVAGGLAALVVARWFEQVLSTFALPGGITLSSLRATGDARSLTVAMLLTAVAAVVIGLAPSIRATGRTPVRDIKRQSGGQVRLGLTRALVAVQVSICVVSIFFAALFVRSMANALATDVGFDRSHLLSASMVAPGDQPYFDAPTSTGLAQRVRRIPGVVTASLGPLPISKGSDLRKVEVSVDGEIRQLSVAVDTVYADMEYFTTLRLPVLRGRGFSDADARGAPPVALVNEAAARQFWPDDDPLEHRIGIPLPSAMRAGRPAEPDFSIVGVVRDVKVRALNESAAPVLYFSRAQHEYFLAGVASGGGLPFVIRSDGQTDGVAAALRDVAAESGLSLRALTTIDESIDQLLMPQRLGRLFLGLLGAMALALTVVGIYGLVSCIVARSTKETGIRMALGADTSQIVRALLRRVFLPVLAGAAIGCVAAYAGGRFVDRFMYGIQGADPSTLLIATVTILSTAAVAALLPTRRALRINPIETLRAD
jgi:predicted permease